MDDFQTGTPIYILQETQESLDRWRRDHNGLSSRQKSFVDMLRLAQGLMVGLRPSDSLELIDTRQTLLGEVAGRNFLSFLYRDTRGLALRASDPLPLDETRPFNHVDVLMAPRHQFEFLDFARAKAVTFGGDSRLSVHDVAAAIVDNLSHVSADGKYCEFGGTRFLVRRAQPSRTNRTNSPNWLM